MNRNHILACTTMAAALLVTSALAVMNTGPVYEINWHTIDGGGGAAAGGAFEVRGTIGQHDAGAVMTGGAFSLAGGFWAGVAGADEFCPADLNNSGVVDAADLAQLLGAWSIPPGTPGCGGMSPCAADLTGDGLVNAADLAILLGAWGSCSGE